jgi:hypothetical protein
MQHNTISFSGFSREETAQMENFLKQARESIGAMWSIESENEAQVVVADMDSMYGQMGFLKARGNGKTTVGVTAGARNDADHLLARPVNQQNIEQLLRELAAVVPQRSDVAPVEVETTVHRITGQQPALSARTTGQQPAAPAVISEPARTTEQQPVFDPRSTAERAVFMAKEPEQPTTFDARHTGQQPAMPATPPARPAELPLGDYIRSGQLSGPVSMQLPGAPMLVLDPATQTYAGGNQLKPFQAYADAVVKADSFEPVAGDELDVLMSKHGGRQPWARLTWFCALQSGKGRLQIGVDPNAKFKLSKWPQTEREFPKHFRIATVMMKGAATLNEIADQSGAPLVEVIDYVNASLATGFAAVE